MSFARILGLVLASLFIGVSALNAQGPIKPGGDGGVVILPKAPAPLALTDTSFTAGDPATEAPEPNDDEDTVDVRILDGDHPDGSGQVGKQDPKTSETIPGPNRLSFSLVRDEHEDDKILIALPVEMANAYAIMLAGEQRVEIPVIVVASHLELDLGLFRMLNELSVSEARIMLATPTNFLVIGVDIDFDTNIVTFSFE